MAFFQGDRDNDFCWLHRDRPCDLADHQGVTRVTHRRSTQICPMATGRPTDKNSLEATRGRLKRTSFVRRSNETRAIDLSGCLPSGSRPGKHDVGEAPQACSRWCPPSTPPRSSAPADAGTPASHPALGFDLNAPPRGVRHGLRRPVEPAPAAQGRRNRVRLVGLHAPPR